MNRRILATILSGFIAGITVSAIVGYGIYIILAIVLLSVVLRSFSDNRSGFYMGVCIITAFVVGSTWFSVYRIEYDKFEKHFDGKNIKLYGIVDENPIKKNGRVVITLKQKNVLFEGKSYKEKGKIAIYVSGDFIAACGDEFIVSGKLVKAPSANNTNGFDYNIYLRSKDVKGSMFVKPADIYKLGNANRLYDKICLFGETMKNRLSGFVGGEAGAVLNGILLGDTSAFSDELKESFARSGISHITAVSGANVSILIAFVMFITAKVGGRRKLRGIISIISVLIYMLLTGFTPSVLRAGIMGIVMLVAIILDKKEDFITSFILSAALILMLNPYSIFNVSFLLSFAATAGIIIFTKPFSRVLVKIIPKFLADVIATSAAAIIMTTPIMVKVFNTFSVIALFTNILVVPFMEILFIGGFAIILFGSIYLPWGIGLGWIMEFLTNIIIYLSNTFSALPFASVFTATPSLLNLMCYGVLVYMLFKITYKKKIKKILLVSAMIMVCTTIFYNFSISGNYKIEFINVGQGDCILISAPKNKHYLIDTGKKSNKDMIPYLKSCGISRLEKVFLTHTDDDHSGGFENVIQNVEVGKVIMPSISFYNPDDYTYRNLAVSYGADVEYVDRFYNFDLGGGLADIAWPEANDIKTNLDNNNSLVIRLEYKGNSFLFTGDIENEAEKNILETDENIDVDVLKISHHGSKSASGEELLEKTSPKYAVISVGKNSYGHPSPEVIKRLENAGCEIYRTDINGNIIFTIKPNGNLSVSTYK